MNNEQKDVRFLIYERDLILALIHSDTYHYNLLYIGYIRLLESVKKREGSKALLIIKIFIYCDFPNKKTYQI